jgi:hypothetical protein
MVGAAIAITIVEGIRARRLNDRARRELRTKESPCRKLEVSLQRGNLHFVIRQDDEAGGLPCAIGC